MFSKIKYLIIKLLVCFSHIIIISCTDGITNPQSITNNAFCYQKQIENHKWEIFTNNLSGSNTINISNHERNDEYPKWSPNGKYIVYRHSLLIGGPVVKLYNLEKKVISSLTPDSGQVGNDGPKWLPNGKICFSYRLRYGAPFTTYIMNPDGSKKKKILDLNPPNYEARTYFYKDSYTFLYVTNSKVYKTNIDNSFNELILDLQPRNDQFITIRDFNPIEGKLLINTNIFPGIESAIGEYNVETKQMEKIISAEKKFVLVLQRYSKDYSKIVFIEINKNGYEEHFLSIFENGKKRRLIKVTGKEWFDYAPMQFSYDGKYVAFSKNTYLDGDWTSWRSVLYVIDIKTAKLYSIDKGRHPSWNPKY